MRPRNRTYAALSCVLFAVLGDAARAAQDLTMPTVEGLDDSGDDVQRPPLELTVQAALQLALGNNIDLRIAETQTEVARFDSLGSWGAFDWVFDSSLSFEDKTEEGTNFLSGGSEISTESYALNLDLNRPLQSGGSLNLHFTSASQETDNQFFTEPENTIDILTLSYVQPLRRGAWKDYATSNQRERALDYAKQLEAQRQARQELLFAVHNSYWALVSALEQRDVASSSLDLGLEQLEQNQRRLDAGVGTEVDVLQARAEVASRIEALLRAETDVDQAMDDLKLGIFAGEDEALWDVEIVPTTPLPDVVSTEGLPTWTQALATALDRRTELVQQRIDVDTARLRHARTLSERLAGIDLTLTANSFGFDADRNPALTDALGYEFPTYSAMLSYNMPIGNKTADNAERSARALVRSALLSRDRLELTVISDVRKAVRDVQYEAEAVRAAEQSLELARRQLESEQARYDEGLSTTFQVLEFQQSLIEAMMSERTARVRFTTSLVALDNAQGLLGEEEAP